LGFIFNNSKIDYSDDPEIRKFCTGDLRSKARFFGPKWSIYMNTPTFAGVARIKGAVIDWIRQVQAIKPGRIFAEEDTDRGMKYPNRVTTAKDALVALKKKFKGVVDKGFRNFATNSHVVGKPILDYLCNVGIVDRKKFETDVKVRSIVTGWVAVLLNDYGRDNIDIAQKGGSFKMTPLSYAKLVNSPAFAKTIVSIKEDFKKQGIEK
jgi:hypothetical protein